MSEAIPMDLEGLDLYANDASGQRRFSIRNFSRTARISDLIKSLIPQMGLREAAAGRPLAYQAFSLRENMHLRGSETVGKVLRNGDEIALLADIQAG